MVHRRLHAAGWLAFPALGGLLVAFSAGHGCITTGLNTPINRPIPGGDRPPRAAITAPTTNLTVEAGTLVTIGYEGEDGESTAVLVIYVDQDQTPDNGNELVLRDNLFVGPGIGTGSLQWNTTGVAAGTYFPFARINDGVNPPVVTGSLGSIQIVPTGTNPLSNPPALQVFEPVANVTVASGDRITVTYAYSDTDTPVTITLLLDKDRDPSNDDVNNPGDPFDPNSNIVILPSAARLPDDPVLPPDVPGQPPQNIDSIDIRRNPRTFPPIITGQFSSVKSYIFTVDFSQIPLRTDGLPYFLRATIDDGDNPPLHVYAVGSVTITGLAERFVDMRNIGFTIAGARFQGFSENEHLGTSIIDAGDADNDTVNDFMMAGRFASPRNRFLAGGAYLVRGRRKLPFPPDVNTNGLPDAGVDAAGNTLDFPVPPVFIAPPPVAPQFQVAGPYQPVNAGRFGGIISVNSIGSFFRGTTYIMPRSYGTGATSVVPNTIPMPADLSNLNSAGLVAMTQIDLTNDGVTDYVFAMPFVSSILEFLDDDPCDGMGDYGDLLPNPFCDAGKGPPGEEDIFGDDTFGGQPDINQGVVIVVSGANDVENDGSANGPEGHDLAGDGVVFSRFVDAGIAGQFDSQETIFDDEFVGRGFAQTPVGLRMRGGWFNFQVPRTVEPLLEFGRTVARLPSFDNDPLDELLVSVPGHASGRGRVDVWLGTNMIGGFYGDDEVRSLPAYTCVNEDPCARGYVGTPVFGTIQGAQIGDRFGFARPGGQVNQDGTTDVIAGAPGADRGGLVDNGVVYILFTPQGGFGDADLATQNLPRAEIHGTHDGDAFGEIQDAVGDINGDSITDVAFASRRFPDDITGNAAAGYVGVIFGDRPLTGENIFFPEQVGTPALVGVRFFGATVDARAGSAIAGAGDFNMDGFDDLLIASPGEIRTINGEQRRGIAYLVFGGPHLTNRSFNLSAVGSADLPGIVFVSPYVQGSADEAAIETVAGIGDIDSDGFGDIALGLPEADFVYPPAPEQRRRNAGEVYIVYGSNFGSNRLPGGGTGAGGGVRP